jgi:NAD(P)-dependent dehydrogenase (short-subunit alcohol dehydrogenase family)
MAQAPKPMRVIVISVAPSRREGRKEALRCIKVTSPALSSRKAIVSLLSSHQRGDPVSARHRSAGHARVVVVSSNAHLDGNVLFDDINFERRPYDPWQAYSQSKTANVLFAVEAARRWAPDGIAVNALHPGAILTNLSRYLDAETTASLVARPQFVFKTPEQGASTSALLAASPLVEGVTGRYFEDNNEAEPAAPGAHRGVAAYALDPLVAARLWQISVDLISG